MLTSPGSVVRGDTLVPFGISPVQLLILLVIVLLIFGAKRLPEIGRGLGSSVREFREGISGSDDDTDVDSDSDEKS
ncbi:MAG: twin-arginine translocase TatA/TatE family subunit [Thermoleophilia bacterium]|nr:twin-arginine translocase TatA/TatE family subunit [Thermoleophilia bacterium]